jgi:hypothetical protein
LSEPEACSSDIGRAQISDERIARRTANAFANAINEPGDHQPLYGGGEGEDRLREGSQAVTERGKKLPAAKPVTESAGEHFHDEGCRFSDTFDDANGECRGAECHYEIERQKGVDHLRQMSMSIETKPSAQTPAGIALTLLDWPARRFGDGYGASGARPAQPRRPRDRETHVRDQC